MASAVAPVNGNGDTYQSWCCARYARVSNALILQSPTNNSPGVCNPVRIRSMIGRYKPSSARSPDKTSVASGIPKGSNDPIITLIWGRVGSSLLWPNCNRPPSVTSWSPETVVASHRITAWDKAWISMLRSFTPTATSIFDMRATTPYVPPAYLVYPQEATYVTSLPDQWGRLYHSHLCPRPQ